jgi:hypothetical protein
VPISPRVVRILFCRINIVNHLRKGYGYYLLCRCIDLGHELNYFVKPETNDKKFYTENEVIPMLDSLSIICLSTLEGIFCNKSSASLWVQTVPLSLLSCSYAPMRLIFISKLIKDKDNAEANSFNLTIRYIDNVRSINIIIQIFLTGFH